MALRKAMIIDDDEDLCFLLKSYLEKIGYKVTTFSTIKAGLAALQDQRPNLLFLDNNLSDGLGWLKIGEITNNFPDVALHLLSGYQYTPATLNQGKKIKVWQKPITHQDLDTFFKRANL